MPTVKFKWHEKVAGLERYLGKDREADTVETSSHGLEGSMTKAVEDEHESHKDKSKNRVLEIYQSWPAQERDLYPPEKFNEMGQELAKRLAPGHLFWVYTHTEKKCIHNHVVICAVNSETGKRLQNKKSLVYKARDINDAIAKENGLSFLEPSMKSKEAKLPENVKAMLARGKQSWRYDLLRKAEFARSVATSYDEYRSILEPLKVYVRVEPKNVSYSYGDREQAIRGRQIGSKFTNDGLIKAFKENDGRFAKDPSLRSRLLGDIGAAFDNKGNYVGTTSGLLLESASYPNLGNKDYSKFTKVDRRRKRVELPADFSSPQGILAGEMKKATSVSLFQYCKENKIPLSKNAKGETTLRGREHIVITSDTGYRNNKGVIGGIVDFVAYHDGTDYLTALSKINKNPRLLLLAPSMGEQKQTYRAFYPPKKEPLISHETKKVLEAFLNFRGVEHSYAETLLKSRNVVMGKDKSIWFLNEKGDSAMEMREEPDKKWSKKRHGKQNGSFFERHTNSKKLVVYRDPLDFFVAHQRGVAPHHSGANVLVLFGDNAHERMDQILALNSHISEVHLIHSGKAYERNSERRFEQDLKAKLNPFDIRVEGISILPSKGKEHGVDFSL